MRKISFGLVAIMFTAVFVPVVVSAQNNAGNQPGTAGENKQSEREARIDEAKQNVANKLSAAEERRVAGLCKASQTVITRLQAKIATTAQSREQRYTRVSEKLDTLLAKLKAASIDTTNLEAAITKMDEKVLTHTSTSMGAYQTALADLIEMDCAEDPSGFKAVILRVREQRKSLVGEAAELKELITVEIKQALTELRAQLAAVNEGVEE